MNDLAGLTWMDGLTGWQGWFYQLVEQDGQADMMDRDEWYGWGDEIINMIGQTSQNP